MALAAGSGCPTPRLGTVKPTVSICSSCHVVPVKGGGVLEAIAALRQARN